MKIVMYHYVKDFKKTKYPQVKGLDKDEFKFQIDYLKTNFNILDPRNIADKIKKKESFNENDCWLTFDDGYIDHYEIVVPILNKYGIKASFFPPVRSTLQETLLDVNKIQLILGKIENPKSLLEEIKKIYEEINNDKSLSFENFFKNIDTSNRYDNPEIVLIKRLLQKELPKEIREKICLRLFTKYVSDNVSKVAKEFYMSLSQVMELKNQGHEIGLHGYNHDWYGKLSIDQQHEEILETLKFWRKNHILDKDFTMCYPYGDYNLDTLKILKKLNCNMALTVKVGSVNKNNYDNLELPRFDTNDFPKTA